MNADDRVLVDFETKTGRKLRLQVFPNAPLATLSVGNRRNGANSVTLDVDDALALRDGLARLVEILTAGAESE